MYFFFDATITWQIKMYKTVIELIKRNKIKLRLT